MTLPRIKVLALGGTIATWADASGAMQMGLGADDLVSAVPLLAALADIDAETVSRVGSHSLGFEQIHALAAWIGAWVAGWFSAAALRWAVAASFLAVALWALKPDAVKIATEWAR